MSIMIVLLTVSLKVLMKTLMKVMIMDILQYLHLYGIYNNGYIPKNEEF